MNSYKYRYNAAKFYFKTFLSEEAVAFGNNRKGTSKITAKNKKKLYIKYLQKIFLLCLQFTASDRFWQACINFVEQCFKLSQIINTIRHSFKISNILTLTNLR